MQVDLETGENLVVKTEVGVIVMHWQGDGSILCVGMNPLGGAISEVKCVNELTGPMAPLTVVEMRKNLPSAQSESSDPWDATDAIAGDNFRLF